MHFDTGNTGFMLIAASLVMLMTPGLAFFYGGLVGRKNVLTIMIQSFLSLAVVDVIWFAVGYSLCFSGGAGAVIGDLRMAFLNGVDLNTPFANGQIPLFVFIVYQMMFAIITPALITGAFANRVRFTAYFIFLIVWLIFVYFPLVHMVWGGGLLAQWGVRDFAGGIVVHASAGFAALASVFFVGPRHVKDRGPHSIPLVALGTGLLWFGWYGFNAGSELRVDQITGACVPEHGPRRLICRGDLADSRLDLRKEAQVPRAAHRVNCRTGVHHARRRLHHARRGHPDRHSFRLRLLPGHHIQEQGAL